jgi:hypothetical protein
VMQPPSASSRNGRATRVAAVGSLPSMAPLLASQSGVTGGVGARPKGILRPYRGVRVCASAGGSRGRQRQQLTILLNQWPLGPRRFDSNVYGCGRQSGGQILPIVCVTFGDLKICPIWRGQPLRALDDRVQAVSSAKIGA